MSRRNKLHILRREQNEIRQAGRAEAIDAEARADAMAAVKSEAESIGQDAPKTKPKKGAAK